MTDTPYAVQVENLVKRFGAFTAVDHISFAVEKGEIFGFLGPNGAGKSTTIRMLCGIITPTAGQGIVGGFDIFRQSEQIKQSIGYMSQKFSLYTDMTPFENIRFYLGVYAVPQAMWPVRTDWVLKMTQLTTERNRLTRDLPPGLRQRLALGCALLHKPRLLFLDEPTSGVDPMTRRRFWEFIRELADQGITVFVTTHYMDEARHCGRIIMISDGRIKASGAPQQIVADLFPGETGCDLNDAFIKLMQREA